MKIIGIETCGGNDMGSTVMFKTRSEAERYRAKHCPDGKVMESEDVTTGESAGFVLLDKIGAYYKVA